MGADQPTTETATEHQRSVLTFLVTAEAVPAEAWERPLAEGKWSPAQVAEHLRLTYEVAARQLSGGEGLQVRTAWWIRPLLRFRFLSRILQAGVFPGEPRAPRELRPGPGPFPRDPLLVQFREAAARAETALARGATKGLVHHVFGRIPPGQSLRFLAIHNLHHAKQIERPEARAG